jgi:hypothetical protein
MLRRNPPANIALNSTDIAHYSYCLLRARDHCLFFVFAPSPFLACEGGLSGLDRIRYGSRTSESLRLVSFLTMDAIP